MIKKDIFDDLADDVQDPFADVETTEELAVKEIRNSISELFRKIELKEQRHNEIIAEIKDLVRSEIAKIKPVQNVIERQVEQVVRHEHASVVHHTQADLPPQKEIIREIRVEIPKKETKVYVEESVVSELKKEIEKLRGELEETDRVARSPMVIPGGSGVIGIPDPGQATDGHVLTIETGSDGKKAKFKAATGGSGASLSGFTVNNPVTLQTFDVSDVSLDELAKIVGTMIGQLQP